MIPEDLSAMEHDSEDLSSASSESRLEGGHPPPLRMPAASITAEEEEGDEDEESLADSNSRSGSTDTLCSVGRGGGGHPSRPPEDEIKVLKIVLRRRPLDLKQYLMLTAGGGGRLGGRALWLTTTADGRTVARIQPRFLRQAAASRYGGQSVRAGVIHHSSNPDRHLTYYYLPKNGSLCQSSSSSSGSISEGLA
jgi:hypothetical protein